MPWGFWEMTLERKSGAAEQGEGVSQILMNEGLGTSGMTSSPCM